MYESPLGNKVWSGYSVGNMGKDGKNVAKTMPKALLTCFNFNL